MKICSAHQPAFLPWLGLIHKIIVSDIFVFMDIAKFGKRAFMHRNKIEIEKLASNDSRSYHINSDKIFQTLGFKAKRSLEEAVKDLCLSFEKGLIVNSFENDLYYNVRRLKNIKAK